MRITIAVLLALATTAHADRRSDTKPALDEFRKYGWLGPPESFEPRVSPTTARWISITTTAAGLSFSGYLWLRANRLEDGDGRAELQLASLGTGLVTIGVGPASGLLVAGEYRRGVSGAVARPLLLGSGALGIGLGAFIMMWGCFETNDCTNAKIGGGVVAGVGGALAAGGLVWGAYDIWDTPRILRKRMPSRTTVAPLVGGDRVGLALTIVQ
jgi:hypothetical protein